MNNIYVITAGEYSDYTILAAYTDKKMAEDFVDQYNSTFSDEYSDKATIETYEGDIPFNKSLIYRVKIKYNGVILDITKEFNYAKFFPDYLGKHKNHIYGEIAIFHIKTDNKEKAIEEANKLREQHINNSEWVPFKIKFVVYDKNYKIIKSANQCVNNANNNKYQKDYFKLKLYYGHYCWFGAEYYDTEEKRLKRLKEYLRVKK